MPALNIGTRVGISAALIACLMGCADNQTIDRKNAPQVESSAFYGVTNAWLVTWTGDLLRTADGGRSWETIPGMAVGEFEHVTFVGDRSGWASTRDGQVLRTTDGGRTWDSIAKLGDSRYGYRLGRIKFLDEAHGWIVNPRQFWRTVDGGISWQQYQSPYAPHKDVFFCSFITPQEGWLSGLGGAFYSSRDGGVTWQEEAGVLQDRDIGEPSFVDNLVGWIAASPKDGIYRTGDGGKTWVLLKDPGKLFSLSSVQFITRNDGWAAGADSADGKPSNQKPILLRTTDGGDSWERVKVAEDEPLVDRVYFADSAHGWLLTRDHIYRTEDTGKTWRIVLSLPPAG